MYYGVLCIFVTTMTRTIGRRCGRHDIISRLREFKKDNERRLEEIRQSKLSRSRIIYNIERDGENSGVCSGLVCAQSNRN